MIVSKIKKWPKKARDNELKDKHTCLTAPKNPNHNARFYNNYFSLIAAGARLKLVEAMFSLNLFALFENTDWVLESDIIEKLKLMPIRAKKWLHLLCCEHFLTKIKIDNQPAYQLPDEFRQLIHSDIWWSMQFFFNSWIVGANEELTDVLRFGAVKTSVSWPPKTKAEAVWLEDWMTRTAWKPINCILEQINFKKVRNLLDVGGGDGTIACELVSTYPHLKATVYNLPKPAQMARRNIASKGLNHQVSVLEGDFIAQDTFPVGFDLILFARVLFDWNESTNRKLLRMAYQALPKNGLIAICEFYKEENNDRCLSIEYRYIFHDDFTSHVLKTAAEYRCMLEEIGFSIIPTNEEKIQPYYSLLLARK